MVPDMSFSGDYMIKQMRSSFFFFLQSVYVTKILQHSNLLLFRLMKNRILVFWSETINASFVHLMLCNCKLLIFMTHCDSNRNNVFFVTLQYCIFFHLLSFCGRSSTSDEPFHIFISISANPIFTAVISN